MKRLSLPILTALTLLLTAAVWCNAGWFARRPARAVCPRRADTRDLLNSAAFARYRQGQPAHWRACLLQQ
ncbi:MAG TPA: hypothetical protein VFA26_11565 [Gemmataceae bacterium]|nr:hypothetical protein [Gemmataceae bacterium]